VARFFLMTDQSPEPIDQSIYLRRYICRSGPPVKHVSGTRSLLGGGAATGYWRTGVGPLQKGTIAMGSITSGVRNIGVAREELRTL